MSQFVVLPGEVLYPIMCPQGLVLKEVNGIRQYPVEQFIGEILKDKIGMIVEENIDFEVIERVIPRGLSNERGCLLCDKGEIVGGHRDEKTFEWFITVADKYNNQSNFPAKDLIPIQHAQRVESPEYLENIKWNKIEEEFEDLLFTIPSVHEMVNWFREKTK